MSSGTTQSRIDIALLYPDLFGAYGDQGNATVLLKRLQWRGIAAQLHRVEFTADIPTEADLYVIGGAEDAAQLLAMERLRTSDAWHAVVNRDVPMLAVGAGLQVLGNSLRTIDGKTHQGAGALDVDTAPGRTRAVGELLTKVSDLDGVGTLTGTENHIGRSSLGADATPLGTVISGVGNDDAVEGARAGKIIGSYLHGPVLARNPALADVLLGWAVGERLAPLELTEVAALRAKYLGDHATE